MNLAVAPILDDECPVLDLGEDVRPVTVAANVQESRHLFAFERLYPLLGIAGPSVDGIDARADGADRLLAAREPRRVIVERRLIACEVNGATGQKGEGEQ